MKEEIHDEQRVSRPTSVIHHERRNPQSQYNTIYKAGQMSGAGGEPPAPEKNYDRLQPPLTEVE